MLPPQHGAFLLAVACASAWLPRTCFPPVLWGFGSPTPYIHLAMDGFFTMFFSSSLRRPKPLHLRAVIKFCVAVSSTPSSIADLGSPRFLSSFSRRGGPLWVRSRGPAGYAYNILVATKGPLVCFSQTCSHVQAQHRHAQEGYRFHSRRVKGKPAQVFGYGGTADWLEGLHHSARQAFRRYRKVASCAAAANEGLRFR